MTKVAHIRVILPEDTKDDDVFNRIRGGQCPMLLDSLVPNPDDPPLQKTKLMVKVVYEARGAQDASETENDINSVLQSVKGVTEVEFI